MKTLAWTVFTLVFVAELCAVVAVGVFGWHIGQRQPWKAIVAVVFVAVAIALWALFAAPHATYDVAWLAVAVKVLVFGAAVIGLWVVGAHKSAVVFAVAVIALHVVAELPAISAHNTS
ncbi:YrdB family protein [Antricoccus suffuscus]|uniref:YrdB family protein n=1 Tax=Antricoccus suffuscus TaxID=1629062 RepID=UPI0014741EE5|nr:YrdB family protein [Antricoccus suffuscus]